jgi:hypothetical protein
MEMRYPILHLALQKLPVAQKFGAFPFSFTQAWWAFFCFFFVGTIVARVPESSRIINIAATISSRFLMIYFDVFRSIHPKLPPLEPKWLFSFSFSFSGNSFRHSPWCRSQQSSITLPITHPGNCFQHFRVGFSGAKLEKLIFGYEIILGSPVFNHHESQPDLYF